MFKNFEELPIFIDTHSLVLELYNRTNSFPRLEQYGITSQLRRSVSSIAANIVEGTNRNTRKELIQFLYNARGSCAETTYFIVLARDLKYISPNEYQGYRERLETIHKQLNGWLRSEKRKL